MSDSSIEASGAHGHFLIVGKSAAVPNTVHDDAEKRRHLLTLAGRQEVAVHRFRYVEAWLPLI